MKTHILTIVSAAAFLVVLAASTNAHATAQYPDRMFFEGKSYSLQTNPMNAYFAKHPKKRPRGLISSALWRGYIASFALKDNTLVLKDIKVQLPKKGKDGKVDRVWTSAKSKLVKEGSALELDWFTGILILPYGKQVQYVHMSYASTYENYILLEITKGKLTGEKRLDYKGYMAFRKKQFRAYQKTPEYKKMVADAKKDGRSQRVVESFLWVYAEDYISRFLDEAPKADKEAVGKSTDGRKKPAPKKKPTPPPK